jgi:hypothetical protein
MILRALNKSGDTLLATTVQESDLLKQLFGREVKVVSNDQVASMVVQHLDARHAVYENVGTGKRTELGQQITSPGQLDVDKSYIVLSPIAGG